MAIKCLTKDGKVPIGIRMLPEDYDVLRKYAFENNTTPNQAILQIVYGSLGIKQGSKGGK